MAARDHHAFQVQVDIDPLAARGAGQVAHDLADQARKLDFLRVVGPADVPVGHAHRRHALLDGAQRLARRLVRDAAALQHHDGGDQLQRVLHAVLGFALPRGVPLESVVSSDGYSYVFVLGEDSVVARRRVETGAVHEDAIEVVSGVEEGERDLFHRFALPGNLPLDPVVREAAEMVVAVFDHGEIFAGRGRKIVGFGLPAPVAALRAAVERPGHGEHRPVHRVPRAVA